MLQSTLRTKQTSRGLFSHMASSVETRAHSIESEHDSRDSILAPTVTDTFEAQARHEQRCLYRLGAGATMFEVDDPDPNAVDNGRVLGVRIEVSVGGANSRTVIPYR